MNLIPKFDNIKDWAKNGVTIETILNGLKINIHPIHWVKESVLKDMLDNYTIRICYSKDGKYYKPNYGNVGYKEFVKYPFLHFCRGDVIRTESDIIASKSFNKFWNIDENELTKGENLNWTDNIEVIEKMDGMLIIPYKDDNGEWQLTSRGSFEYDVIPVARKYFNENYKDFCNMLHGFYPIFEIISDDSFIKVEYSKEKHGLYCIGIVDFFGNGMPIKNYIDSMDYNKIKHPKIYSSLRDEKAITAFVNSFDKYYDFEGVVVNFEHGGIIKIKAEKYFEVKLQNITNTEYLYDLWNENKIDDIISHIPPTKAEEVIKITNSFVELKNKLIEKYKKMEPELSKLHDVKKVAIFLKDNIEPKYFNYFINKYKNNAQSLEKIRRTFILAEIEKNN